MESPTRHPNDGVLDLMTDSDALSPASRVPSPPQILQNLDCMRVAGFRSHFSAQNLENTGLKSQNLDFKELNSSVRLGCDDYCEAILMVSTYGAQGQMSQDLADGLWKAVDCFIASSTQTVSVQWHIILIDLWRPMEYKWYLCRRLSRRLLISPLPTNSLATRSARTSWHWLQQTPNVVM
jgi:hypothetical protein